MFLPVDAAPQDRWDGLDEIVVVGSLDAGVGRAAVLTAEDLDTFARGDVLRTLRTVPGLQLGEEEGFGLRPNIGIRGSGSERSAKIALMEDGVPIAPAPYSAPAAYYFPTTTRISAVEVTKGAATVQYGPQTTAGALHLFSTPLPEETAGLIRLSAGTNDRLTGHGWIGTRAALTDAVDGAVMVEVVRDQSDGFKELPTGADTGFEIDDLVAKAGLYWGEASLIAKVQRSEQVSNETYLGLTEADYAADPYGRYAASVLDRFEGDHDTYQVTLRQPIGAATLTALAYRTEFARSWYKLQEIETDDFLGAGGASGSGDCDGLSEIVSNPGACGSELAVLRGADSPDDAVQIRDNNRMYDAEGLQLALSGDFATGALSHDAILSVRLHRDGVDRFQDQDGYAFRGGRLVLTNDQADGEQANRLTEADALAVYAQDRLTYGMATLSLGFRYEQVETMQERWDTPDRTLTPDSVRRNEFDVFLPAARLDLAVTDGLTLFAGVHEGFGLPSAGARDGEAERSVNTEAGLVWDGALGGDAARLELVGYNTDYSNLLGQCTASSGSDDCDIGDSFNAGEVTAYGIEAVATYAPEVLGWRLPTTLSYGWTVAEFDTAFSSDFDPWGDVEANDRLPYVPEHQATLVLGAEHGRFAGFAALAYTDEARATAGQGAIPAADLIEDRTILDLSVRYQLNDRFALRAFADNVTDEVYTASLRPAGRRPGKPREIRVGVEAAF